jgi:hypothetical protein
MSESNNVKFVENNGKWMWKLYDEQGSVIYRSAEFETERKAREDYEVNSNQSLNAPVPESVPEAGTTPSENNSASQDNKALPSEANTAI